MSKDVLSIKYRPKKLSDVIGQTSVVTTLTHAVENNNIHHAYLFHGTRGTGKTTCSRILAAMINCVDGPTVSPCGKCDHCKAIFLGRHSDIIEMDAASNGKVDEIRELKKSAYLSPVSGARKKIYFIDEAHSVTPQGSEALLKITEEPPSHVIFILATTEYQKMKGTIISRCQNHFFQKVFWTQIVDHLYKIVKKEQIEIDDSAIKQCAVLANGSVRDALQNLNKLNDFAGGEKITIEMAQNVFGVVNEDIYYQLMSCIVGEDGKPSISKGYLLINKIFTSGIDVSQFLQGLEEHLRGLQIMLTAPKTDSLLALTEEEKKRLKVEAGRIDVVKMNKIDDQLKEVRKWLPYNISPEKLFDQWLMRSIINCHLSKE